MKKSDRMGHGTNQNAQIVGKIRRLLIMYLPMVRMDSRTFILDVEGELKFGFDNGVKIFDKIIVVDLTSTSEMRDEELPYKAGDMIECTGQFTRTACEMIFDNEFVTMPIFVATRLRGLV